MQLLTSCKVVHTSSSQSRQPMSVSLLLGQYIQQKVSPRTTSKHGRDGQGLQHKWHTLQQVARLSNQYILRSGDETGAAFWIDQIKSTGSRVLML